jgi:predicted amino acid dehydrogenase
VTRVGWLFHLIDGDDLARLVPAVRGAGRAAREASLAAVVSRLRPVLARETLVTSITGERVRFLPILIPITAGQIRRALERGRAGPLRKFVERGIDVAERAGCDLVSLGQYTSILLANGLAARPRALGLTTGNALAVATGLSALAREVPDLARRTVAVVGAAGNIGETVARLLTPRGRGLILVGRDAPGSVARMRRLALPGARIAVRPEACREADVVIVAVSSPEAVVGPGDLARDATVLDLSVPFGVEAAGRDDVRVIRGGVLRLPHGEDLGIPYFPLDRGLAFACMAEGMVLGLEGIRDRTYTGRITEGSVTAIAAAADRHGFRLGGLKTQSVLGAAHA